MPLSFQSRHVGEVTVVTCNGRIVEGAESAGLQQHLKDLLPYHPHVVLDLGQVHFIDSGGLGLLVRFLTRIRSAHGGLKLCAAQASFREVLRITRLATILESYDSEAEAISAFYQRTESASVPYRFDTDILCVERSADVLAYVRALLKQAGYAVMTVDNLPDALILLRVTRPKLVVISPELRSARVSQTAEKFNRLADALPVIELPADFSSDEAGQAGRRLLDRVRATVGASDSSVDTVP